MNKRNDLLHNVDDMLNSIDLVLSQDKLARAVDRLIESAAPCVNESPSPSPFTWEAAWGEMLGDPEFSLEFRKCGCDQPSCDLCEIRHKICQDCHNVEKVGLPGMASRTLAKIDRVHIDQIAYQQLLEDDYDKYYANRT